MRRLPRSAIIVVVAAFSATSLGLAEFLSRYHPSSAFFLMPPRSWELGAGALLALVRKDSGSTRGIVGELAPFLGLFLIGVGVFGFDAGTRYPSLWTVIPVLGAVLFIRFADAGGLAGRLLAWRPLVAVGLISYSAYLWHQPLFAFARIISLTEPSSTIYACLIAATLVFAYISWRFVETPFRKGGTISIRALPTWLGPAAGGLVVFGCVGFATTGFAWLAPALIRNLDDELAVNHGLSENCEGQFTLSPACRTSEAPEVLVWGDSFAMALVNGIVASDPGVKLIQHTKSVCGPILGISPVVYPQYREEWADGCNTFNEQVLAYLRSQSTIRYAVLSSPFDGYLGPSAMVLYRGRTIRPTIEFVARKLEETAIALEKLGIRVTLVSPPPRNGMDIGHCLAKAIDVYGNPALCDVALRDNNERFYATQKLFDRLQAMGLRTVVLSDLLCKEGTCRAFEGGVMLYRNSGHLSKIGSTYLGMRYDFADLLTGRHPRVLPMRGP